MPSGWWEPARLRRWAMGSAGFQTSGVPALGPAPEPRSAPLQALRAAAGVCCPGLAHVALHPLPAAALAGVLERAERQAESPRGPPATSKAHQEGIRYVRARASGRRGRGCLGRGGRSQGPGLYPDQPCGPPSVWTLSLDLRLLGSSCGLLLRPGWHVAGCGPGTGYGWGWP